MHKRRYLTFAFIYALTIGGYGNFRLIDIETIYSDGLPRSFVALALRINARIASDDIFASGHEHHTIFYVAWIWHMRADWRVDKDVDGCNDVYCCDDPPPGPGKPNALAVVDEMWLKSMLLDLSE